MTIIPDTKDWTWVLRQPCPQCRFDATGVAREAVGPILRETVARWVTVLSTRDDVRTRPGPATWSPLEYGCHVRDASTLYLTRLGLMLTEDDPLFANWDQDEAALRQRYREQDPAVVAAELETAGVALAGAFEKVGDDQWHRPGRRGDGAAFTVETFARYFLHDPVHHLYDVAGTTPWW
jgi:hypothetical protein